VASLAATDVHTVTGHRGSATAAPAAREIRDAAGATREEQSMARDDVWEKAREQLVKQRQLVVEALAEGYKQGATENSIDLLVKIQAAIDVLDISDDEDMDDADEE
jgi:hypothetical protein